MPFQSSLRPLVFLFAFALVALSVGCGKSDRGAPGGVAVATPPAASQTVPPAGQRSLEVTANFDVELGGSERGASLAQTLAALATDRGGFVQDLEVGDGSQDGRLVLRVPASAIDDVRTRLASSGPVTHEQITTKDVTDAIADIDARVKTANIEETRIRRLLDEKTGSLADVLAAEKALAEVRDTIERLEAEQRVAHGRVDLATVVITLRYPLAASEAPFFHRAGRAAADGVTFAKDLSTGAFMVALRSGPTLLILAALGWVSLRVGKRLLGRTQKPRTT